MKVRTLVADLALSAAAGYLGTKAMEPVSMKLYELEPAEARAREDAARPGAPYRIAAEKLTKVFGLELNEKQLDRLSLVFHYGLAIQWAPLYPFLRRRTSLTPITAGLATGAAMSIVADELMTPCLRVQRPQPRLPAHHPPARVRRTPGIRPRRRRCGRGRLDGHRRPAIKDPVNLAAPRQDQGRAVTGGACPSAATGEGARQERWGGRMTVGPGLRSVWARRGYRRLWAARTVSQAGDVLQFTHWRYSSTSSPVQGSGSPAWCWPRSRGAAARAAGWAAGQPAATGEPPTCMGSAGRRAS